MLYYYASSFSAPHSSQAKFAESNFRNLYLPSTDKNNVLIIGKFHVENKKTLLKLSYSRPILLTYDTELFASLLEDNVPLETLFSQAENVEAVVCTEYFQGKGCSDFRLQHKNDGKAVFSIPDNEDSKKSWVFAIKTH